MSDGSSAGPLRFEVLGPIRAFRGEEPIDLGPPSQRAVLAALLLSPGEPVPLERIVAALWDGDPPDNGADVVLRCIGALRRSLDPERTSLLALTDGGYVLRVGAGAVDAGQFRASLAQARSEHRTGNLDTATVVVHRALSLWQQEPLTGMTGAIFEAARARLHRERAEAATLLTAQSATRPTHVTPPQEPTRIAPRQEPTRTAPPQEPTWVAPPQEPTRTAPAQEPTRAAAPARAEPVRPEPAPTDPTRLDPARTEKIATPEYPEAIDPWDGHDLFPPDPMSIL
ncbi:hypothetical protein GCM10010168_22680 [Actinoplanes ianthinogenes]|uniref:OmpR/PhoB-type domain-containing protein n=1 Tax=Actinoplanes ianthinogenes TaxID=122358 RepID=A0ABM7M8J9_9ACTN|nr:BTAD domain-containing putative transcriptional regulator [Actinoplanes ianthinogenes]BCJ47909.1 hypothetical protein Aiant_85660 [Actinoplanes ianthinogenes]GGR05007.1 hypothetical protein GCM10010168_22680 [Actinoplanes ianthinogenes]